MKKISNLLLVLLFIFCLISCNKTETPEIKETEEVNDEIINETSFDEYLDNNINNFDFSKIDDLFSYKINPSLISNIQIPNYILSVEVDGIEEYERFNEYNALFWQEEKIIYGFSDSLDEEQFVKVDLLELEEIVEEKFDHLTGKNFIDIINLYLKQITGNNDITISKMFNKINLNSDDFVAKENNIYELKPEAIARVIATISNNELTNDDAIQLIKNNFEKLAMGFKYEGGKISDIGIVVEANIVEKFEIKYSLSLKLIYNDENISSVEYGSNLFVNYYELEKEDFIITSYGSIHKGEFLLNYTVITDVTTNVIINLKSNVINLTMVETDKENDSEKNVIFNLEISEKEITDINFVYSSKIDRDEDFVNIHLKAEEDIEIPNVLLEDAVNIFDYFEEEPLPTEEIE